MAVALGAVTLISTLSHGYASARTDPLAQADAFLKSRNLWQAQRNLTRNEKHALGMALVTPDRQISDETLASYLKNPTAWKNTGSNGRGMTRTVLNSLPQVAATPGLDHTMELAANNNSANFRGYSTEILASAALNRYSDKGRHAQMTRMGGMIRGVDGRMRESDGAVLLGADGVPRLVTVKSVASIKSVDNAMKKAADQLALRNLQPNGVRRAGVIVVGYDAPEVRAKLKRKDWQNSANRTGAKLLVLAVNQSTGETERLASFAPDPNAKIKPKRAKRRRPRNPRYQGRRNSALGDAVAARGMLLRSGATLGRRAPTGSYQRRSRVASTRVNYRRFRSYRAYRSARPR